MADVMVTEYVPAVLVEKLCAVEVKVPGPTQRYVTPPVVLVAVTVTVVSVQDSGPLLVAVTPAGGVIFCPRLVEAVVVQPLAVFVIVTEYVPGTLVAKLGAILVNPPGPAQLYVTPGVVLVALTVAVIKVQVSGPVLVAVTPAGGTMLCDNTVDATAVQPLALVRVTEYRPGVLVVKLGAEDVIPGPTQR